MSIKYYLQNIPTTQNPSNKSGRVKQHGTLDENAILDEMLKRSNNLSKQEIFAVIDLYTEVLSDQVKEGFGVITRLANFRPDIKGVFNSAADSFDPARHNFRAAISEGVVLKRKMRSAMGERQTTSAVSAPLLADYYDYDTATSNRLLTPGSIGKITGEALKFNEFNANEGIYLIREVDNGAIKVETVSVLTDKRLMFLIPAKLAIGDYKLEVRRACKGSSEIYVGELFEKITVQKD